MKKGLDIGTTPVRIFTSEEKVGRYTLANWGPEHVYVENVGQFTAFRLEPGESFQDFGGQNLCVRTHALMSRVTVEYDLLEKPREQKSNDWCEGWAKGVEAGAAAQRALDEEIIEELRKAIKNGMMILDKIERR